MSDQNLQDILKRSKGVTSPGNRPEGISLFANKGIVAGMAIVTILSIGAMIWAFSGPGTPESPLPDNPGATQPNKPGTFGSGRTPATSGNVQKPGVVDNGNIKVEFKEPKRNIQTDTRPPNRNTGPGY